MQNLGESQLSTTSTAAANVQPDPTGAVQLPDSPLSASLSAFDTFMAEAVEAVKAQRLAQLQTPAQLPVAAPDCSTVSKCLSDSLELSQSNGADTWQLHSTVQTGLVQSEPNSFASGRVLNEQLEPFYSYLQHDQPQGACEAVTQLTGTSLVLDPTSSQTDGVLALPSPQDAQMQWPPSAAVDCHQTFAKLQGSDALFSLAQTAEQAQPLENDSVLGCLSQPQALDVGTESTLLGTKTVFGDFVDMPPTPLLSPGTTAVPAEVYSASCKCEAAAFPDDQASATVGYGTAAMPSGLPSAAAATAAPNLSGAPFQPPTASTQSAYSTASPNDTYSAPTAAPSSLVMETLQKLHTGIDIRFPPSNVQSVKLGMVAHFLLDVRKGPCGPCAATMHEIALHLFSHRTRYAHLLKDGEKAQKAADLVASAPDVFIVNQHDEVGTYVKLRVSAIQAALGELELDEQRLPSAAPEMTRMQSHAACKTFQNAGNGDDTADPVVLSTSGTAILIQSHDASISPSDSTAAPAAYTTAPTSASGDSTFRQNHCPLPTSPRVAPVSANANATAAAAAVSAGTPETDVASLQAAIAQRWSQHTCQDVKHRIIACALAAVQDGPCGPCSMSKPMLGDVLMRERAQWSHLPGAKESSYLTQLLDAAPDVFEVIPVAGKQPNIRLRLQAFSQHLKRASADGTASTSKMNQAVVTSSQDTELASTSYATALQSAIAKHWPGSTCQHAQYRILALALAGLQEGPCGPHSLLKPKLGQALAAKRDLWSQLPGAQTAAGLTQLLEAAPNEFEIIPIPGKHASGHQPNIKLRLQAFSSYMRNIQVATGDTLRNAAAPGSAANGHNGPKHGGASQAGATAVAPSGGAVGNSAAMNAGQSGSAVNQASASSASCTPEARASSGAPSAMAPLAEAPAVAGTLPPYAPLTGAPMATTTLVAKQVAASTNTASQPSNANSTSSVITAASQTSKGPSSSSSPTIASKEALVTAIHATWPTDADPMTVFARTVALALTNMETSPTGPYSASVSTLGQHVSVEDVWASCGQPKPPLKLGSLSALLPGQYFNVASIPGSDKLVTLKISSLELAAEPAMPAMQYMKMVNFVDLKTTLYIIWPPSMDSNPFITFSRIIALKLAELVCGGTHGSIISNTDSVNEKSINSTPALTMSNIGILIRPSLWQKFGGEKPRLARLVAALCPDVFTMEATGLGGDLAVSLKLSNLLSRSMVQQIAARQAQLMDATSNTASQSAASSMQSGTTVAAVPAASTPAAAAGVTSVRPAALDSNTCADAEHVKLLIDRHIGTNVSSPKQQLRMRVAKWLARTTNHKHGLYTLPVAAVERMILGSNSLALWEQHCTQAAAVGDKVPSSPIQLFYQTYFTVWPDKHSGEKLIRLNVDKLLRADSCSIPTASASRALPAPPQPPNCMEPPSSKHIVACSNSATVTASTPPPPSLTFTSAASQSARMDGNSKHVDSMPSSTDVITRQGKASSRSSVSGSKNTTPEVASQGGPNSTSGDDSISQRSDQGTISLATGINGSRVKSESSSAAVGGLERSPASTGSTPPAVGSADVLQALATAQEYVMKLTAAVLQQAAGENSAASYASLLPTISIAQLYFMQLSSLVTKHQAASPSSPAVANMMKMLAAAQDQFAQLCMELMQPQPSAGVMALVANMQLHFMRLSSAISACFAGI